MECRSQWFIGRNRYIPAHRPKLRVHVTLDGDLQPIGPGEGACQLLGVPLPSIFNGRDQDAESPLRREPVVKLQFLPCWTFLPFRFSFSQVPSPFLLSIAVTMWHTLHMSEKKVPTSSNTRREGGPALKFDPATFRVIRQQTGISVARLAQLIGASLSTVHKWELPETHPDHRDPGGAFVVDAAQILGVTPLDFYNTLRYDDGAATE